MKALRSALLGVGSSATWPAYLGLLAYTARQAPWPREQAILLATALAMTAMAAFAANLVGWIFGPCGAAEEVVGIPRDVCRQLRHSLLVLLGAALVLLLPRMLLVQGLVAPGGRPLSAPGVCRLLSLGFEATAWVVAYRLVRGGSSLVGWLPELPERLSWVHERRRTVATALLAVLGGMIALDVRGYSFTTRRLGLGAVQTLAVAALSWVLYRVLLRAIDQHAWRWIRAELALDESADNDPDHPDDLADRLRRLAAYLVPVLGVLAGAWVWNVDLALFRFLAEQQVFAVDKQAVTLGDLTQAGVILLVSAAAWRHMSTFFSLTLFPRIPDDPGVRFAVVTLCRYVVVGVGACSALASVHLGLEKISVVLAALGVGLGFGLQEIVSNFVCGIILLLERPIQIGDIVTVAGMSGKVDRINIRATTIINADNQSMIVPNREFITGNLVNWTHKDKVVRIAIRVNVAYGTDPDRVVDLLLAVAREDPDVLRNPVPSATLEGFGDGSLTFGFYTFVPNPSISPRAKHRLCAQIQARFEAEGIEIPYPTHELHLRSVPDDSALKNAHLHTPFRFDPPGPPTPDPKLASAAAAIEPKYCGVDD